MAEQFITPRVNQASLHRHVGAIVRLIGQVVAVEGQKVVVRASDGNNVHVMAGPGSSYMSQYVEVIGRVNPDLSIEEMKCCEFPGEFDLANYDRLVNLAAGKYRELFC